MCSILAYFSLSAAQRRGFGDATLNFQSTASHLFITLYMQIRCGHSMPSYEPRANRCTAYSSMTSRHTTQQKKRGAADVSFSPVPQICVVADPFVIGNVVCNKITKGQCP